MGTTNQFSNEHNESGRLDQIVANLMGISRAQAQTWLELGAVKVAGSVITKASFKLRGGEFLEINPLPDLKAQVMPEKISLDVLFEDEHMIAINKAPGMTTHPTPSTCSGTLVNALMGHGVPLAYIDQEFDAEGYRPGIVHRLDKNTSGVIVVAKTEEAHARLGAAFKQRVTRKKYIAIVTGEPPSPLRVDVPIGRDPVHKNKMLAGGGINPRSAQTDYRVLLRAQHHAVVLAEPYTGRTHQIRVHAAYIGHALVADTTYGRYSPILSRHALHAWQISFPHPITRQELRLRAPLPQDMISAWVTLGGHWEMPEHCPHPDFITD